MNIHEFANSLALYPETTSVENQYKDPNKVTNLEIFLAEATRHRHSLFVGEAAGYLGMAQTGIGFTSPYQLDGSTHFFLDGIADRLTVSKIYPKGENTAKYFWDAMRENNIVPITWNAFPFHPHEEGNKSTNGKPSSEQINDGVQYLQMLLDLISPEKIIAVGGYASELLNRCGIAHKHVRHPSFGGSNIFKQQIREIYSNAGR